MAGDLLVGVTALALGVAMTFAGYRLALLLLPIWAYFAGFWWGADAFIALTGERFMGYVLGWATGFFLGVALAVLAYLFWNVAVAVLGASVGATLGAGLMAAFDVEPGAAMTLIAAVAAVALAATTLALGSPKRLLIALTAVGGAGTLVAGLLLAVDAIDRAAMQTGALAAIIGASIWWPLIWLALALAGIAVQVRGTRRFTLDAPRSRLSGVPGAAA